MRFFSEHTLDTLCVFIIANYRKTRKYAKASFRNGLPRLGSARASRGDRFLRRAPKTAEAGARDDG
jgi:hypothetical protein